MLICSERKKKATELRKECMWMCSLMRRKNWLFLSSVCPALAKTKMLISILMCDIFSRRWRLTALWMVWWSPHAEIWSLKRTPRGTASKIKRRTFFFSSCPASRVRTLQSLFLKNHFTVRSLHSTERPSLSAEPQMSHQTGFSPSRTASGQQFPRSHFTQDVPFTPRKPGAAFSFVSSTFWRGFPVEMNLKHSPFLMTLIETQLQ